MNNVKFENFSVGGNVLELDKGCTLALWNEDGEGNLTADAHIDLNPKQLNDLIRSLSMFVAK